MADPDKPALPGEPARPAPSWWRLVRDFLHDLFDLQFRTFIATRMLPGVYGFGIVLAGVFMMYWVLLRFRDSVWEGLVWIVLGPVAFVGIVTALRITLEFVLAVFRMAWYVEHVAGRTEMIAQELPRFGFLRTLLFGDKTSPPPKSGPIDPPP